MYASCIISVLFRLVLKKTIIIWNIRQSLNDLKAIKFFSRVVIRLTCYFSFFPDFTIFNSKQAILQHSYYGFDKHKSFYLPNGVDKINHSKKINNDTLRNEWNLDKN